MGRPGSTSPRTPRILRSTIKQSNGPYISECRFISEFTDDATNGRRLLGAKLTADGAAARRRGARVYMDDPRCDTCAGVLVHDVHMIQCDEDVYNVEHATASARLVLASPPNLRLETGLDRVDGPSRAA